MKDPRPYVTMHDGMPEHPKVVVLSDKAFRHWVTLICWSNRNRTDGRVPTVLARTQGARVTAELTSVGLLEESGSDYCLHDYLHHQRSADEIEELRSKRQAAGRAGGLARAQASATAPAKQAGSKAEAALTSNPASTKQDKTRPAEPDGFDEWYAAYPRREARGGAAKAYRVALRKTDAPTLLAAARTYAEAQRGTARQYVALPATWLNNERWLDETPAAPAVTFDQIGATWQVDDQQARELWTTYRDEGARDPAWWSARFPLRPGRRVPA